MTLALFLHAWFLFEHTLYEAWTNGAPDHPTRAVYLGSGPQALSVAQQINGHLTEAGSVWEIWP